MAANPTLAEYLLDIDPDSDLWKLWYDPSPYWTRRWIESFLTIDNERGEIVRFRLYPQQNMMLEQATGRDATVKGRQTRASSLILARNLRRMVTGFGLKCLVMTQDDQTTATFRARIKHHLRDLAGHGIVIPVGLDNDNELVLEGFENRFMFTSGEQRVAGRAYTAHIVHLSEIAHYPEAKARKLMGDITPSVPGPPNGWFDIESTPMGMQNLFADYVLDARPFNPASMWTAHLYPWWLEPRYRVGTTPDLDLMVSSAEYEKMVNEFRPTPEEDKLMQMHGLDVGQILWRRINFAELAKTDTPFLQEYVESFETCFATVSAGFFSSPDGLDHIGYYRNLITEPVLVRSELKYRGAEVSFYGPNLLIWELPQPGDLYVGWLDCAGGGLDERSDYTALVVLNADTKHHVATLRLKIAPDEAAPMAAAVMTYYNEGLLGGERDAYGAAALSALQALGYPNLWYFYESGSPGGAQVWAHPSAVRNKILNALRKAVFSHALVTRDRALIQEMGAFGWSQTQGKRKVMGQRSHDDLVMALAGCCYIAQDYGRNLAQQAREAPEDVVIGPYGLVLARRQTRTGVRQKEPWMR